MLNRARVRLAVVGLTVASVSGLATPASRAESTKDLRRDVQAILRRVDDAEAREAIATDRLTKIERQLRKTEATLRGASGLIRLRVRTAYMSGIQNEPLVAMLTSGDPQRAIDRVSMLNAATRNDKANLLEAKVLMRRLTMQQADARAARKDIEKAQRALTADSRRLTAMLEAARKAERAVEAATQATAMRARSAPRATRTRNLVLVGNYACLVGPTNAYSDTWGAPRSGGRRHKGTDVFAPHGSPAYAVVDGVISQVGNGGKGGITLWLRGDDGHKYYYAHNARNLARSGQRVTAGEQIATVGDSGNARGTAAHVHFEFHPGGNGAVNPYPFVRRVCG